MVYRESLWVQYAHVLRAGQDNLKLELAVILDFCSEFDFEDGEMMWQEESESDFETKKIFLE